jgi:O-antigen/teichoic acid export membrane protein
LKKKDHISKTLSGLKWSGFSQFSIQIINLILNIVLARLLSPYEFGIIAMITVFVSFMQLFKDFGFGSVLISQKNVDDLDYSTVFWVNLMTGLILAFLLYSSRTLISSFYSEPILEKLISVISILFVVQAFNFVQEIKLKKKLEYRKLSIVGILSVVFSGSIGIIFALTGFGVWSLIFKSLTFTVIYLILIWRLSSWSPSFKFSFSRFKFYLKSGLALIGTKMINYFSKNIDNALIGKFVGASSLGIYNRAFSLMSFPVHQITGVLSSVLFPSLSIIQNDIKRVKEIYFKATQITSFIIFLILGLLFINAREFVLILLGEQWEELIPILKILIFPAALQSICLLTENIFRSQNKYELELKLSLINSFFSVIAIVIGLQFGIIGVSKAILFSTILTTIITLSATAKVLGDSFFYIFKYIFPSFIGFVILIVFDYFTQTFEFLEFSLFTRSFSLSIIGLFLYIGFIYIVNKKTLFDAILLFKKIIKFSEKK